ncbi:hypothetical protein MRB53_007676 [Persea americana]|uniref:Uncharacterized protein n=1 Tax=Persea americana TaxID=3435 RepID=A0ACC2MKN2_PERAE|nr:hypothetical protein MRB53_007676 [Persea americana]
MALISSQKKVVQQIISTHLPDDNYDVDKTALLSMAQDILCNEFSALTSDPITGSNVRITELDNEPRKESTERLAFFLHKIGCELSCNCSGGGGIKSITLTLFEKLVRYSWEDKLVLVLSAFAVSYGEFRLLSKPPETNPLAKYVLQLKPLPEIGKLETVISELLTVVINVTKTIIELNGLPSQYISLDKPAYTDYEVSTAVYWAVRGIVTCSSQSISFMNQQNMVSIIEAEEKMIALTDRLKNSDVKLKTISEEKKIKEGYHRIQSIIRTIQTDNMKILFELIQTKDGKALFNGATQAEASLDVLKSKTVILFISYLDISEEQVKEVDRQVCKPGTQYEIVWLPIRTGTKMETQEIENTIRSKASLMRCHSLHYSVTLESYVIQYIKKEWLLEKKEAMVVFDAYGKVVNSNAYQMIMVWGSAAYPFHAQKEETLWRKWSIERLLIEGIVSEKQQWVEEKRVICLYGGDDLVWIREFKIKTKAAVEKEGIILEFIYVGKKYTEIIKKEELATVWEEQKISQFHARAELIYQSKTQLRMSITGDKTLKQLRALLDAGGDGSGWTIIGQGSNDMAVIMDESLARKSLDHLEKKKDEIKITKENFISILHRAIITVKRGPELIDVHKYCNHIFVPTGNMVCADCQLPLEKESMHKIYVENIKASSQQSGSVAAGKPYSSRFVSK